MTTFDFSTKLGSGGPTNKLRPFDILVGEVMLLVSRRFFCVDGVVYCNRSVPTFIDGWAFSEIPVSNTPAV